MDGEDGTRPLAGRVALVTGGSGGIGTALCRALAGAGADVAVAYGRHGAPARDLAAALARDGVRAVALGADLGDAEAPERLVGDVERALGPVDVLVANAGIARVGDPEAIDAARWDATMAVNLRAPYLLARRVLPGMRERRYGRILLTSSVAAFIGGRIGPDYAASKAGLHGLVHYLAARTAASGITVNAIAPALIEGTRMLPGSPAELAPLVPVGRLGRPREVADLMLAMLGNGYLTSQVVSLDGGMHPR